MQPYPEIPDEVYKKHIGDQFIAYNGKILGFGKTTQEAFAEAKKKDPDIDDKEFLVARIYPEIIVA